VNLGVVSKCEILLGIAIKQVGQLHKNYFSIRKNQSNKKRNYTLKKQFFKSFSGNTAMTKKTTFWTISEAARQLGYKSRSQLYRLIEEGSLRDYVYQDQKGRTYLLAEPEGKKDLYSWVKSITRWQVNGVFRCV